VAIEGPSPGSGDTAGNLGLKVFDSVAPGTYKCEVTLQGRRAEEFKAPKIRAFKVASAEERVLIVELKSINHWIEIVLLDESGNPAAGERYRIVLPDQQTREGTLDAKGRARIQSIEAGRCEVTFPDMDSDAWEKK
jgi:hypothetical protein